MAGLKLEIAQEPAFFSVEEEALLNLLRTSDCLHRAFHLKTRDWGVTSTQYNVVRQQRDRHDRRVVWTQISQTGLELLKEMDPVIQQLPIDLLGHLDKAELAELIRLLELARTRSEESTAPLAPVSCTGERCRDGQTTANGAPK